MRAIIEAVERWSHQLDFLEDNWKEITDLATREVMVECRGTANPKLVREHLEHMLRWDQPPPQSFPPTTYYEHSS